MPTIITDSNLSGNDFEVFVSKQTTKGAINASPVFTPYRRTEGRGKTTVSYVESGLVKSNRQGRSQIQDNAAYGAEISSELNKQAIDDLISSIHATEVQTTVADTDFEAVADGFSGTANFADVSEGDYIFMEGFTDSDIDTAYLIATKTDDDNITTVPVPAATESAGASVTMTSFKSANAKAATLYAVQTRAVDTSKAGDIDYHTIYDNVIDSMSIEIPESGIATYSVTMKGEAKIAGTAIISGQADATALTDDSVSAVQNITDFFIDGVSQKAVVKSLSIELANNYQEDQAAGVLGARLSYGDFGCTGSMSIRSPKSAPFTWRDYYESGTRVSVGVLITHSDGDQTLLLMRRCVVNEVSSPDGSNAVANSDASITAEENPSTASTLEVFRNWS